MKLPYRYITKIDPQIKSFFESIALKNSISTKFLGYWIENTSDKVLGPFPRFKSYEEWRTMNPYSELHYVRYFFELTTDEQSHVATLSIDIDKKVAFTFSIEELGSFHFFELNKEILEPSDFEILDNYIGEKFK